MQKIIPRIIINNPQRLFNHKQILGAFQWQLDPLEYLESATLLHALR